MSARLMKKLSLYVFLVLVWCNLTNISKAEEMEAFCLINHLDLQLAKLNPDDYYRFAGKEISFIISYEDNLIADASEDAEVSLITGIRGIMGVQEFEKNPNGIRYKNEIKVDAGNENELKYAYVNILKIVNKKPTELIAKVDQTGFSMSSWIFRIGCRDYKFSEKEKLEAKNLPKPGDLPEWFPKLIEKMEKSGN